MGSNDGTERGDFLGASKALFKFWSKLKKSPAADDKVAYLDLIKTADNAGTDDKLSTVQELKAVFKASVAPQDWVGEEGSANLKDFADGLSDDDLKSVVGELAPRNQPTVPLPFQGNLLGIAPDDTAPFQYQNKTQQYARGPKLIVLTSNPGKDEVIKLEEGQPLNDRASNLATISGQSWIPDTLKQENLMPGSNGYIYKHFANKQKPEDEEKLLYADENGNAKWFRGDQFLQVDYFPYQSKHFDGEIRKHFAAPNSSKSRLKKLLPSQKLMMEWLVAFVRLYQTWELEQQPIFVARKSNNWRVAFEKFVDQKDDQGNNVYPDASALLESFDNRLFHYSSGGTWLSFSNIVSRTAYDELEDLNGKGLNKDKKKQRRAEICAQDRHVFREAVEALHGAEK